MSAPRRADCSDRVLALLRAVAGFLFALHGAQKFGMFGGLDGAGAVAPAMTLIWFAAVIEIVAGPALAVGFWTRPMAFLASGEMAVAYWTAHAPRGPLPITNGGELAVLYCFLWLFLAFHGARVWSFDAIVGARTDEAGAERCA
jgi:putative oxidoreductase